MLERKWSPLFKMWESWWLIPFITFVYIPFVYHNGIVLAWQNSIDLPTFWTAAQAAYGHSWTPYDTNSLQTLLPGQTVLPFIYPPTSLLTFYPLWFLSMQSAKVWMLILNHALLMSSLGLILFKLIQLDFRKNPILIFFCLIICFHFQPHFACMATGQVNYFLFFALISCWVLARSGRDLSAGVLLGIAIIIKTYPLIYFPFLLILGRWRMLLGASVLVLSAGIFSIVILPAQIWIDWYTRVLSTAGYSEAIVDVLFADHPFNLSLNGQLARAFGSNRGSWAKVFAYMVAISLFFASMNVIWRSKKAMEAICLDAVMLVVPPLMFLVAPISWDNHLVYLMGSILVALKCLVNWRRNIFVQSGLCLAIALIAAPGFLAYKFFGVLILWGVTIFCTIRSTVSAPILIPKRKSLPVRVEKEFHEVAPG